MAHVVVTVVYYKRSCVPRLQKRRVELAYKHSRVGAGSTMHKGAPPEAIRQSNIHLTCAAP
eukprot:1162028-Pelagomonas_calceolata.AAC.5